MARKKLKCVQCGNKLEEWLPGFSVRTGCCDKVGCPNFHLIQVGI